MSTTKASGVSTAPILGSDVGRVTTSKGRATPAGPGFATVLAAARPILKGAEAIATVLPGGPLVAAAIRAPTVMSGSGYGPGGGAHGARPGGVPVSPRVPIGGMGGASGAPSSVDPVAGAASEHPQVEGVLADSQSFNLYYLQLQEQISAENRSYSALSNVLKARHDTVKNAIGNIR